MRQKIVGTYRLGRERVQLVIREGTGGEFWLYPGDIDYPRIKIGADYDYWWEVMSTLFHEVFELLLERANCRLTPTNYLPDDHSQYKFYLDHIQFSDLCAKAALFCSDALPALATAYHEWKKVTKEKRRKK